MCLHTFFASLTKIMGPQTLLWTGMRILFEAISKDPLKLKDGFKLKIIIKYNHHYFYPKYSI